MDHVKKMFLMDPKRITSDSFLMPEPSISMDPKLQILQNLHREMETILKKEHISDDEKVKSYNQTLQRYIDYQSQYRQPHPIPVSVTPESSISHSSDAIMSVQAELLRVVPKNTRKHAEALLIRIRDQPNMSWNSNGEFMYKGEVQQGSNIIDLIGELMRARKSITKSPPGMNTFVTALKDTNTPQELILNKRRYIAHSINENDNDVSETPKNRRTPKNIRLARGRATPITRWEVL